MNKKYNLYMPKELVIDFQKVSTEGLSAFMIRQMTEEIKERRLSYLTICKCGQKPHINRVIKNNGKCVYCQEPLLSKI